MANLYVDVDGDKAAERLRRTVRRLRDTGRYFPDLRRDDDCVGYLLDMLFPDGVPREWHVANLSLAPERATLALRPAIRAAEAWPFPPGFSLAVVGSWPRNVPQPVFRIRDVFEIADTPTRSFEEQHEAFVYQAERVPRGVRLTENFLNEGLAERLPLISRDTRDRLEDWSAFIEWKRRLVRACARGLRYVAREWTPKGELAFRLQVRDEAALADALRVLRNDTLQAFPLEASSDPWEFTPAEEGEQRGRRRQQGVTLGRPVQREPERTGNARSADEPALLATWNIAVADEDSQQIEDAADEGARQALRKALLERVPEQGFLSVSLAGDLSLLRRHEQALERLRDQGGFSPYLAAYLFDVSAARQSEAAGAEPAWLARELKPSQREAVRKMLDAPDLCLVQGPPGTGKTTVIAEAIAHMVARGETVLLASQAHTAVDNALGRLAANPAVRAIRLGPAGKVTEDGQPFVGERSLGRYYAALAGHCEGQHLARWRQQDAALHALQAWCEKAEFVLSDGEAAQARLAQHVAQEDVLQNAADEALVILQQEQRRQEDAEAEARAAEALAQVLGDPAESSAVPALPNALAQEAGAAAAAVLALEPHGVRLSATAEEWRDLPSRRAALLALLARDAARAANAHERLVRDADRLAARPVGSSQDPATRLHIEQLSDEIERLTELLVEQGSETVRQELQRKRLERKALQQNSASALDAQACRELFDDPRPWLSVGGDMANWLAGLRAALVAIEAPLQAAGAALRRLAEAAWVVAKRPSGTQVNEGPWRAARQALQRHRAATEELRQRVAELAGGANATRADHPEPATLPGAPTDALSGLRQALVASRAMQQLLREQAALQHETRAAWEPLLSEWVRDLREARCAAADWERLEYEWPAHCNVVAITCNERPQTLDDQGHAGFDVAIVDEVSKATPLELLLPLMRARRAVLVGDHRQLPPLFQESMDAVSFEDAAEQAEEGSAQAVALTKENLRRYERMVTASLFKEHFETAPDSLRGRLSEQFRMHPQIMQLVNYFYEGTLTCGLENPDVERAHGLRLHDANGRDLLGHEDHVFWIDTSSDLHGQPAGEEADAPRTNRLEASLIAQMLRRFEEQARATRKPGDRKLSVGVVSFYAGQLRLIREAERAARPAGGWSAIDVDINTVIRYQGKEKDIVLVSLVRNDGGRARRHASSANVARYEFINVAFSRARCLLVVLGGCSTFENWEVALPRMEGKGTVRRRVYREMLNRLRLDGRVAPARHVMAPAAAARPRGARPSKGSRR